MNCHTIRNLIDQAEKPERPPLDVAGHLAVCANCRVFADERVALRDLLVSTGRVGAPANFELLLKARLAAGLGRSRMAWLTPALYLKLGTAAAILIVSFVVVQQMTTRQPPPPAEPSQRANALVPPQLTPQPAPPLHDAKLTEESRGDSAEGLPAVVVYSHATSRGRGHYIGARPDSELELAGGPVVLIRGPEMEVGMPAISIGAQPMVYATAGQPFRAVPASY